jgi:hypothetical protein
LGTVTHLHTSQANVSPQSLYLFAFAKRSGAAKRQE